jgi:hypothetical protein
MKESGKKAQNIFKGIYEGVHIAAHQKPDADTEN